MKTAAPPLGTVVFENSWDQFAPEAELLAVAEHDFSDLSSPILVACRDHEQFEDFIFSEGLLCSEVRRFKPGRYTPDSYRRDKILLLLPYWYENPAVRAMVDIWVNREDRYTVELETPLPGNKLRRLLLMLALCLAAWSCLAWLVFRL